MGKGDKEWLTYLKLIVNIASLGLNEGVKFSSNS